MQTKPFKPMLACDWKKDKIKFPVYVQPKIDGVHMLNRGGEVLGRSLKKIANVSIREVFGGLQYHGFCGEIIAGTVPTGDSLCRDTTSAVNRITGEPECTWYVFDYCTDETVEMPYLKRMQALLNTYKTLPEEHKKNIEIITTSTCNTLEELLLFEAECLASGFEGVIIRNTKSPYKYGRSAGAGELWRIKRFIEEEIFVTEILEGNKNNNESTTNELGHTERSSHQENMQPNGEVGTIVGTLLKDVFDPTTGALLFKKGLKINVSPGEMTQKECKFYWDNPDKIVGKVVKFKSFPKGVKDKPRFATFVSIRDAVDLVDY